MTDRFSARGLTGLVVCAADDGLTRAVEKLIAAIPGDELLMCAISMNIVADVDRFLVRVARELVIMATVDGHLMRIIKRMLVMAANRFVWRAVDGWIIKIAADTFLMCAIEMVITIAVGMFLVSAVVKELVFEVTVVGKPICAVHRFLMGGVDRILVRIIEGLVLAVSVDGHPVCAVRGFLTISTGRLLTCATDSVPLIMVEGSVVLVIDIICTNGGGGLRFRFELLFHPAVLGLAVSLQLNVFHGFRNPLLLTHGVLFSFKFLKKRLKS